MQKPKIYSPINKAVDVAVLKLANGKVTVGCPKCGYGFLAFDRLLRGSEKCPECGAKLNWAKVKFKSKVFY